MANGAQESEGISHLGSKAEEQYRALTGATPLPKASLGDALLDETHRVEVKQIKKEKSTTVNQVRAVKYITLAVLYVPDATWYVVPACDVVELVARKGRGQHTENPFESNTLSIRQLDAFVVADHTHLRQATLDAVAKSSQRPELEAAMAWILEEARSLAAESCRRVNALLEA